MEKLLPIGAGLVIGFLIGLTGMGGGVITSYSIHYTKLYEWMTRAAETNRGVLDAIFNSERPGKIIDIGGGQGFLIRAVLESNPQLSGVLFDLPEVVANVTLSEEIASSYNFV